MRGGRLFLLALAGAACRPGGAPPNVVQGDACLVAARSAQPESVTIGASGGVDPGYVLRQRTRAESVVVAHVHETLVRVTCDERIIPALADRWTMRDDGRAWSFDLRAGATFADGTPVTAMSVAEAWRERRSASMGPTDARAGAVEGVTVESERITVHFRDAQREGPRLLADSYYAVHHRPSPSAPASGSGAYLAPSLLAARAGSPTPAPIRLAPRAAGDGPVLVLIAPGSGDERDLIDAGVDLMVSSEPRILAYAATRSDLRVRPLPADRAYVLVTPARSAQGAAAPIDSNDPRWDALRASLARDVIREPAPASGAWWGSVGGVGQCVLPATMTTPRWTSRRASAGARRVVYPSGDRLAGELARRLVALSAHDPGSALRAQLGDLLPELTEGTATSLVATGLGESEIAASLTNGDDLAYLLALPLRALDPCVAWRELVSRAPWIAPVVPVLLGQAGASLITSANAPAVTIDWDNTVRVVSRAGSSRDHR